jgi:FAD/FMN-containing dehydrogenase
MSLLSPPTDHPIDRDHLRTAVAGRVVTPDDPDWDQARQAWNLSVDQHPELVVVPGSAEDVAAVVRLAVASGRRVALQTTGHGAATLPDLSGVILVRTTDLQGVEVDPATRRARVPAGALARDLVAAAAVHGLAFPAGSSPDVGVVGYTLGGGIGWLGRRHGLACNRVVAAEVVTAEGELRRVDADHDPELFWALRGGGGSFAAVTALEVELVPLRAVHAGTLLWSLEHAAEVLHAWAVWTSELPDAVTSIARLLRFPPLPDLPDHLRGRQLVAVESAFLDGIEAADRLLRPLRALRPEADTFASVPVGQLGELHGDPEHPVPSVGDHLLVRELPATAVDALLAVAGPGADTGLLAVDVRHLGGALARTSAAHGALDRLDAGYAVFAVGVPATPEVAAAIPTWLAALQTGLAPWAADQGYLNFAEQAIDPARLFTDDRFARLRAVKASYDPDDRFVSNHRIPGSTA